MEVNPYQPQYRMDNAWYYDWDVESGVIWDTSCINECRVLATLRDDGYYELSPQIPADSRGLSHVPPAALEAEEAFGYPPLPSRQR